MMNDSRGKFEVHLSQLDEKLIFNLERSHPTGDFILARRDNDKEYIISRALGVVLSIPIHQFMHVLFIKAILSASCLLITTTL